MDVLQTTYAQRMLTLGVRRVRYGYAMGTPTNAMGTLTNAEILSMLKKFDVGPAYPERHAYARHTPGIRHAYAMHTSSTPSTRPAYVGGFIKKIHETFLSFASHFSPIKDTGFIFKT
jgi:hypothetical protein